MKKLTIVRVVEILLMLLALATWLIPIKVASAKPKAETKILVVAIHETGNYKSDDIIIKDNAIIAKPKNSQSTNRPGRSSQYAAPTSHEGLFDGRNYSKEEVQQLIRDYSAEYGIPADLPLRVAQCESGFNQFSKNKNSTASGVFQYIASTWKNTEAGRNNVSVLAADANVEMAIKSISSGGISNWNASRSCWSK